MATSAMRLVAICAAITIVLCSTSSRAQKTDFVFLVYPTKYMPKRDMTILKDFMKNLVEGTDVNSGTVRIGLINIKEGKRVGFDLGSFRDKMSVLKALDSVQMGSSTRTKLVNVLESTRKEVFSAEAGQRADSEKVLVLILNGFSKRDDEIEMREEAKNLKENNVTILTVGVREDVDVIKMAAIASHPENVLVSESVKDVMDLRRGMIEQVPACKRNGC